MWRRTTDPESFKTGASKLAVKGTALDKAQALRNRLVKPLIVRSAYRSPKHNRAVAGAIRSNHMEGAAFDTAMTNHDPTAFEAAARRPRDRNELAQRLRDGSF